MPHLNVFAVSSRAVISVAAGQFYLRVIVLVTVEQIFDTFASTTTAVLKRLFVLMQFAVVVLVKLTCFSKTVQRTGRYRASR